MSNTSEWAKRTAAAMKKDRNQETLRQEALIADQRAKDSGGPILWNELRDGLKEKCAALNLEMGEDVLTFELVPNSTVSIRRNSSVLTGIYDASAHRVEFKHLTFSNIFFIKVESIGKCVWSNRGRDFSSDELSGRALDSFIRNIEL